MSESLHIVQLHAMDQHAIEELSDLLVRVVEDGASIGFLAPLKREEAIDYWTEVIQPGILIWIGYVGSKICGTVQLHLSMKANGTHRAEVAKLMVHPDYRGMGIAKKLMLSVEASAVINGRTLLVLDTRAGDPSNILYRSLGYTEAGRIPRYAKSSDGKLDDTIYYYKEMPEVR